MQEVMMSLPLWFIERVAKRLITYFTGLTWVDCTEEARATGMPYRHAYAAGDDGLMWVLAQREDSRYTMERVSKKGSDDWQNQLMGDLTQDQLVAVWLHVTRTNNQFMGVA